MKSDRRLSVAIGSLCCVALFIAGCGKSGVPRLDLSGVVTYKGQPVPAGEIRFEPDLSKGGKGPAGFAAIIDGKFDTSLEDKGPVAGPIGITVIGYTSSEAFAPALFPEHEYKTNLSESDYDFNIEVPEKK